MTEIKVGSVVLVKPSFLNNPENSKGFVYELYDDFDDASKKGASIILENGHNLGGFSYHEQEKYCELLYDSGVNYEFENVVALGVDFPIIIKPVFEK